ncbi:TPA: hypothetical protein SMR69_003491, partial [Proteus mirabilis]|nr:hypothetical protein [Proteus mirabilis]
MTARNRLEVAWQCIAKLRTLRISFCAFTAQLKTLTEPYRKSNLRKTVNGVFCGAVISGEQVRFSIRIYTMSKSLVFKGNEITPFDNGDNKIWFTSSQMAKLLEYKNEKSVTNLYNANKDEFSDDMTMVTETMTNGINNNLRKKKVRIFSVRGAHLIGMLANTDVAKSLRRWLLDLAEKESKPQTGLANLDMNELKTLTINEMQNRLVAADNWSFENFGRKGSDLMNLRKRHLKKIRKAKKAI